MTEDTYAGRTTVVASGGQQVSVTAYRRGWVVLVGTILGLAIAPGAGPITTAISFAVAFILSAFLSRSAIRRLVTVQATDWIDLDEQLAFEYAAFGAEPARAGYVPRPGVVARELKKCRRVLVQLPLTGVLLVVACTVSGLIGDPPVTRIVSFVLVALLIGHLAIQTWKRARAVRTLQYLDADV